MTSLLSTYRRSVRFAFVALIVGLTFSALDATAQQAPVPRVDIFGGYSYFYPNSTLTGVLPGGVTPVSSCLCAIPRGAGVTVTYNFLPWLGLSADLSGNWSPHEVSPADRIAKSSFYSLAAGPKFTHRGRHFSPFAEVLFGEQRLAPELFQRSDTFGILAGGGLDIRINRHISFRPIRADFAYSNHSFGINPSVASTNIRGLRLESGILFTFGGAAPVAPLLHSPDVQAAVAATILPAPIVAPAPHFAPPTVMCSAQPAMVNAGEASTITAVGNSPEGLPLTYSYASTEGAISGTETTAMLMTAGAAPGVVDVTCSVVDSHGQRASQIANVTIQPLAIVPRVLPRDLCSISFARDSRRPVRVENEAKACLDDIALVLQQQSDATLVLTGNAQAGEAPSAHRASQRAINTREYLVTDKGIDASRISIYTGMQNSRTVTTILVPAGAAADTGSSKPVAERANGSHQR